MQMMNIVWQESGKFNTDIVGLYVHDSKSNFLLEHVHTYCNFKRGQKNVLFL